MIAFGCAITEPDTYEECAGKGFRLVAEPDTQVLAHAAAGSIFRSYNLLLDKAAEIEGLEAFVLAHQDAEIADPEFLAKLRAALADPEVAVVGCVGAIGVRSIAWWEGSVTWASFVHRYREMGGGELPSFSWNGEGLPPYARTGEVDTIDGFVMGLSPWAVKNVRFDESLGQLHGYDFDYSCQVREAGRKIVTADFKVIHHHSLELVSDPETWIEAHMRVAEKWDGRLPGVGVAGGDWKQRARRAEAEAAVSRARVVSIRLQREARLAELERRTAELQEVADTVLGGTTWKLTEPLRRIRALLRSERDRSEPEAPRPPGQPSA
jgi:hypothetical protein